MPPSRLRGFRPGRVEASRVRHRAPGKKTMETDIVRRIIWAGLLAVTGALASLTAHRLAAAIWVRVFREEPPA